MVSSNKLILLVSQLANKRNICKLLLVIPLFLDESWLRRGVRTDNGESQ